MSGRPLRFLGVVIGGWAALRVAMLWPLAAPPVPPQMALAPAAPPAARPPLAAEAPPIKSPPVIWARALRRGDALAGRGGRRGDPRRIALALAALTRMGSAAPPPLAMPAASAAADSAAGSTPASPALVVPAASPGAARLRAAFWLVAREGQGLGGPFGGQLGGSQAGVRIAYAVDRGRRLALAARIATPLAGAGAEAAFGIEWQPTRLPVRLIAEQRVAIDRGGGGPAVGVVGGAGPVPIHGFRLEAYGQAGVIGRARGIGYADGAVRIDRRLLTRHGVELSAGGGLWGAAQPGAARLDIGPLIGLTLPAGDRQLRLAIEWRERIGGRAAPGSGPAISLGADF